MTEQLRHDWVRLSAIILCNSHSKGCQSYIPENTSVPWYSNGAYWVIKILLVLHSSPLISGIISSKCVWLDSPNVQPFCNTLSEVNSFAIKSVYTQKGCFGTINTKAANCDSSIHVYLIYLKLAIQSFCVYSSRVFINRYLSLVSYLW